MNNLFNFKGNEVEIFEYKGEILFNPRDIAKCIGLSESTLRDHISKFTKTQVIKLKNKDISDVGLIDFRKLNNAGENFLKEPGLYKLIFKSEKSEAEEFQDWVTDSVLPTLRQTGGYVIEDREEEFVFKYFPSFSDDVKLTMVDDLIKQNKSLKVNADKYKNFMSTDGTFAFRELVKHLNGLGLDLKENQVRNKLKDDGIICKQGKKYVITEEGVRDGYGVIKDVIINEQNRPVTKYTEKLRDYLLEEFKNIG